MGIFKNKEKVSIIFKDGFYTIKGVETLSDKHLQFAVNEMSKQMKFREKGESAQRRTVLQNIKRFFKILKKVLEKTPRQQHITALVPLSLEVRH